MNPIFPQPNPAAPAPLVDLFPLHPAPPFAQRDRLDRIATLDAEDMTAGLVWLAMQSPATFDAMLEALESDAGDDDGDTSAEPEPFCAECGADIGIFLRFGMDWRHCKGGGTTSKIELFDPGHKPVLAWRVTRLPTKR